MEDADDGACRRARHIAAVAVGRIGGHVRAHHRRLCPHPAAVQRRHRRLRRRARASRRPRGQCISDRCRAPPHGCRARRGASALGDIGDHEIPRHRAHAAIGREGHGHPWRQDDHRRAEELSRRPAPLGADRHHGRGRQYPYPQSDDLRAGRDPLASLHAGGNDRAVGGRQGSRPRHVRPQLLGSCRPCRPHDLPDMGARLDGRPARTDAGQGGVAAPLAATLPPVGRFRSALRHGAADARRGVEAQGDAVGAHGRHPRRTLPARRGAEALRG